MADNKKTLIVSIVAVIAFIISIVAVSYAFYTATTNVQGDDITRNDITAKIETTLTEDNEINIPNMIPGDSFIKTFSISSNIDLTYYISIMEIQNTFNSTSDIKYVLEEDEVEIGSGTFPTAENEVFNLSTKATKFTAGDTKHYKLTVTYENTKVDQRDDMNKVISGKIFVNGVNE